MAVSQVSLARASPA